MRMTILLITLLLSGVLLLSAGCTEEAIAIVPDTPASPTATPAASATPSVSKFLSASLVDLQKHIMTPPYWVAMVRVDNNGPVDAYHVITLVQLIDEEDGTVKDWKAKDFECITAGDHKTYTFKLYGDEGRQYRAEVQITSTQDDR
jgi:ABC-type transport system substrate-binding protein